tara:strand:+ start:30 stop:485 length:456 start_codon:yes stop_codon:yes gene_type:complete
MRNFFLAILFTILLNSCGYNSVYKENQNSDFTISSLELNGNDEMNNLVKKKLERYIGKESEKKFQIKIDTDYFKKPISKDKTGKIQNYKLVTNLYSEIKIENKVKNISFSETFNMQNYTDKFEENKFENKTKNNLTNIMLDKIITYLTNYK